MGVNRPYRRTCRQFVDGSYDEGDRWKYLLHPKFAEAPEQYIRAFLILQDDFKKIFDYIEPADTNLKCYSFRIHKLLLRSCIEIEANCKAILRENGYTKVGDWNMNAYRKIEKSHRLSSYLVKLPVWDGDGSLRQPFEAWSKNGKLLWYEAYNDTKHDRHTNFEQANFDHLVDAMSGLVVLLSAQFKTHNYFSLVEILFIEEPHDDMEAAIGDYFRIKFPNDWPEEDRYDFDWKKLENEEDPFQQFPYS